jgi:mycoredoxin
LHQSEDGSHVLGQEDKLGYFSQNEVTGVEGSLMQDEIIFYGTKWCPDCRRSKKFLDRRGIAYRYVDIDRDREARAYVQEMNNGNRSVPTIVFPDGGILVEPSNEELAGKLGLETQE